MTSVSIEDQYLFWLYSRIGNVEETRPSRAYWFLLRQLLETEFKWFIHNDDNRVEDGRTLRLDFLAEMRINEEDVHQGWLAAHCSMLEMLVALAVRLEFEAEFTVSKWFWEMLNNAGLSGYVDRRYDGGAVEYIVRRIIDRTYSPNGDGGLFPLRHPPCDQRTYELWYQSQAYLQERH